jgi:tripartite-type tricarboxylate transporter receptor subunit TctC
MDGLLRVGCGILARVKDATTRLSRLLVSLLLSAAAGASSAHAYPSKPVRVIVPFAPGASGNIGTAAVAASAPDGYTLLLGFDGTMVINPHVYAKLAWDTLRDFAPVTKLGDATLILVAHPSVPARDVRELVSLKTPFSYGTAGTGSTPHLAGELLAQRTGIALTHVPYRRFRGRLMDRHPRPG